jgi:hypothetical protein
MIAHVEMLLANRQRHEDKAAVRYTTLEGVVAEFTRKMQALEDAQDKLSRCTCDHAPGFEIDTRKHNGPLDAQFTLARFKRMAGEDAR